MAANVAAGTARAPGSTARLAVPALTLAVFLTSLSGFALGPLLPAMARETGTPVAALGQVPAVAALVAAAMGLIVGPIADRIGLRTALALALCALAAGTVGLGVAPGIALLLAAAAVVGVGRAGTAPICQAIAGTRFDGDARRRVLACLVAATSVSVVIGVPALTTIAAAASWRVALAAMGLVVLGAALAAARLVGSDGRRATGARASALADVYLPILRDRPTVGVIGGHLLQTAGSHTVLTYLGAFLAARHGLGTQQIGWVYMAAGVGAVVGSAAVGGRLGRRPLRGLVVGSRLAISALVGCALLLPLPVAPATALLLAGFVFAAVATVGTHALLTGETPGGRATTMALNGTATGLGQACGAGLGGLLLIVGGFPLVALGAVAWNAAAGAVVWWTRRRAGAVWVPALRPAAA